jgi:sterol desaturase/sphingolipid hydroxylase (fatty acid hydroxylase superfamily)
MGAVPNMLFTTAILLTGVFLLLLGLERRTALRPRTHALLPRLFLNFVVAVLAFLTAALLVRPVVTSLLDRTGSDSFGVLQIAPLSPAVQFAVGLLLMDLSFYYWHVANHRFPFLWRFHNVHHFDPDLDVSTAVRFHFGEVALSAVFRVVQVTVIGPSGWTYVIYELAFQANTLFHHSNVKLPITLERVLNWVLVTPRMHGIHHSQVRDETNSNYSVVFSWWDRLHRSIGLDIPQSAIVIGVPGYSQPADNHFWNVCVVPFQRQRQYWRDSGHPAIAIRSRSRKPTRQRLAD